MIRPQGGDLFTSLCGDRRRSSYLYVGSQALVCCSMPELPEVETMRRGVLPAVGSRIVQVTRPRIAAKPITMEPGLAALRRRLTGKRLSACERVGKRIVLVFDTADRLVIEPRMTGLVLLDADPPDESHLRLKLELADRGQEQLLFWDRRGLGTVRLWSEAAFANWLEAGSLGPDALSVTSELLRARLGRSRRAIKVALLDQAAVAGIGNLYASEILHLAQIDPRSRCDRLRARAWPRLVDAIHHVLEEAIRYEGSTLSDGTYRNALNQAGNYQNQHRVYDRAGLPCPRCGDGAILRLVQAQRSTFYCPRCQQRNG